MIKGEYKIWSYFLIINLGHSTKKYLLGFYSWVSFLCWGFHSNCSSSMNRFRGVTQLYSSLQTHTFSCAIYNNAFGSNVSEWDCRVHAVQHRNLPTYFYASANEGLDLIHVLYNITHCKDSIVVKWIVHLGILNDQLYLSFSLFHTCFFTIAFCYVTETHIYVSRLSTLEILHYFQLY